MRESFVVVEPTGRASRRGFGLPVQAEVCSDGAEAAVGGHRRGVHRWPCDAKALSSPSSARSCARARNVPQCSAPGAGARNVAFFGMF